MEKKIPPGKLYCGTYNPWIQGLNKLNYNNRWYTAGCHGRLYLWARMEDPPASIWNRMQQGLDHKGGSVIYKIREIPGMSKQDAIFLVGRLAGRDKLNRAHHQMSVRAVAVQLERLCKSVQGEKQGKERVRAIQKAFKFLTGYETFEEAYKNEREDRWMRDTGMGEGPEKKFVVSFDVNTLDEAQLDELGGYISDDEI